MKTIEIYDPITSNKPIGCGPGGDRELFRMSTMIKALENEGKSIKRYGLAENPEMFAMNKTVNDLVESEGVAALPIVVVDGEIKSKGSYPSNHDLATWAGMSKDELVMMMMKAKMANKSFCGGDCC
ncbi:MAG: arsenic metallochaperone ArsD family protein [Acetobacterium woodii]|nr:arsenic metallochaperone ArsD family protein [Acetobacterium woodii]